MAGSRGARPGAADDRRLAGAVGATLEERPGCSPARAADRRLALLLVPASAMGATLPLLARALAHATPTFGRVLGRLYGWNTLGACPGDPGLAIWF